MDDPIEIARRRERLIARCAAQRDDIAGALRALRGPIAIADRICSAALYLRAHPALVIAAVAGLAVLGRRNLLSVATRGLAVWRVWRLASAWVEEGMAFARRRGRGAGKS